MLRTFLAVPLEAFRSEISAFVGEGWRLCKDVRWAEPSGVHVTLHFFGSTAEEELEKIRAAVRPVTSSSKPFALSLTSPGFFPNPHKPRVVWLGLGGEVTALKDLQARLERELAQAGFALEERPYVPHATVGRVKPGRRPGPGLDRLRFQPTELRRVDTAVLFKSTLTPQGSRYEPLEIFPFAQGPAA